MTCCIFVVKGGRGVTPRGRLQTRELNVRCTLHPPSQGYLFFAVCEGPSTHRDREHRVRSLHCLAFAFSFFFFPSPPSRNRAYRETWFISTIAFDPAKARAWLRFAFLLPILAHGVRSTAVSFHNLFIEVAVSFQHRLGARCFFFKTGSGNVR